MFERNDTLSQEERKLYTGRLLKLHQIIADDLKVTTYTHQHWVDTGHTADFQNHCGTCACAFGHAMLHADQFEGLPELLRRNELGNFWNIRFGTVHVMDGFHYFGPGAYEHIFNGGAFMNENKSMPEVTRQDVLRRIETHITEYLGCKLIEEKIDGAAT